MNVTDSTDHFSDEGLMDLHIIYVKAIRIKPASIYKIKEATHYHSLLQRVPMEHKWEVEKLLRDANIQKD